MAMAMADNFKGLPIADLISAPLIAASEAQAKLAITTYEYIKKIGFSDDKGTIPRLIKFNLERPIQTETGIGKSSMTVSAPFLGLVPMASLLIDNITVDFQMEVSTAETDKSNSAADATLTASGGFGPFRVAVAGKVSTSKESTRTTNQTAKYQIHVSASQQPAPEALSRLMDILANCTVPLEINGETSAPVSP